MNELSTAHRKPWARQRLRIPFHLSLGALAVLLTVAALHLSSVSGRVAVAQPGVATCTIHPDTVISQPLVLAGDRLTVTHTLLPRCQERQGPLHVVLVLDVSGSMAGEPSREMKRAARDFVKQLDLDANPGRQVGVVGFNTSAQTLCELTDSELRVLSCINKLGSGGGTSITAGILAGIKVFTRASREVADPSSLHEVMLVLANGEDNTGCGPVRRAAGQARGYGIELLSISVGADADEACMASIATSSRHLHVGAATMLHAAFSHFASKIPFLAVDSMSVRVELPPNMAWIEASASPPPSEIGPGGERLLWHVDELDRGPVEIRYALRPLEVGRWPPILSGSAELLETSGARTSVPLPTGRVQVLGPRPLPRP